MSTLHINQLTVSYRKSIAIDEVTLPPIEGPVIVGILGPNGSGKSTLLRAIAKNLPSTGDVTIAGEHQGKADCVYMPQALPQPTALLAYELVLSHLHALTEVASPTELAERIEVTFSDLGMTQLAMREMNTLSGGQRQLVGFALALARQPSVLLLDEPTSALDIRWQIQLTRMVRNYVRAENSISLMAMHDIDLAARACDKIAILDRGRLVSFGTPREALSVINLASVYGVDTRLYDRSDGSLGVEVLKPTKEGEAGHA